MGTPRVASAASAPPSGCAAMVKNGYKGPGPPIVSKTLTRVTTVPGMADIPRGPNPYNSYYTYYRTMIFKWGTKHLITRGPWG